MSTVGSAVPAREGIDWDCHIGRSWVTHPLEDECPCPQQPCGLIRMSEIDPSCPQHAWSAAKTMRQSHSHADCTRPEGATDV